jgi:hypothetical protein
LAVRSGKSLFCHSVSEHRNRHIVGRAKDVRLEVFRPTPVVRQLQKRVLVGVAHILFVPEYSPEHRYQFLTVTLHCGQHPTLALLQDLGDGIVPDQPTTGRLTNHKRFVQIVFHPPNPSLLRRTT